MLYVCALFLGLEETKDCLFQLRGSLRVGCVGTKTRGHYRVNTSARPRVTITKISWIILDFFKSIVCIGNTGKTFEV